MPHIQVKDLEMYYERIGVGAPVVFLHSAYSRGILAFSCQILAFQSTYTCYFPDFRGHGRTRCQRLDWSTPELAEDINEWMRVMSIPRAHLIGYSMGANVGLYMAVKHPSRVGSLVTIGCSGFAEPQGADDFEPEALLRNGQQGIIDRMKANHEEAHRGNWQEFMHQSARDWRGYPRLTQEELSGIQAPSFFIAGENDPYASQAQLSFLCTLVKDSRYQIIPGCDHRPHMLGGNAPLVNHEILQFLLAHPLETSSG